MLQHWALKPPMNEKKNTWAQFFLITHHLSDRKNIVRINALNPSKPEQCGLRTVLCVQTTVVMVGTTSSTPMPPNTSEQALSADCTDKSKSI